MKTITETLNLAPQGKNFLTADWPAPANVKTLITTRNGGVSQGVYQSLNLGSHVGDDPDAVRRNREIVQEQVGLPLPTSIKSTAPSSSTLPKHWITRPTPTLRWTTREKPPAPR